MQQVATQLIVLGPHRSGTSAVAGLLARMGAYVGPPEQDFPWHPANPKGFNERIDVVDLNDTLVARDGGAQWSTFRPGDADAAARAGFTERARALVADLEQHPLSVLKDPRLCLTFALWRPLFSNPVCVIVLRNPLEVAQSLQARDSGSLQVGLAMWEHHMREALRGSVGVPRLVVRYEDVVADPLVFSRRLCGQLVPLGVTGLDPERIADWIDPELRHARLDWAALEGVANAQQLALCDALRDGSALTQAVAGVLSAGAEDALAQRRRELQVAAGLRGEIAHLYARIGALQGELLVLQGRIEEVAVLERAVHALLASWRWRLGNGAVDLLRAVLLRPEVPQPKDQILRILERVARDP